MSALVVLGCGQSPTGGAGAGAATPTAETPEPSSAPSSPISSAPARRSNPPTPSPTPTLEETETPTPQQAPRSSGSGGDSPSARASEEPEPSKSPKPKPKRTPEEPDPSPSRERSGKRVVYLTFDDGPSEYSRQILRILNRYNAKATFFVIGQNAADNPAGVRAMRAAGMAVQNHSWGHPNLTTLSNSEIRSQISRTDRAIREAGGGNSDCVRPPYGASSSRVRSVLRDMGRRQMLWTIDTLDWQRPGADRIYRRVVNEVERGSIVLLHDGGGVRTQTVAALPRILRALKDDGYRFGTLCD